MSLTNLCDICQGSRTIRLRVHRPLVVIPFPEAISTEPVEGSREFPCPQCCETVKVGKVGAIQEDSFVTTRISDPSFTEHVRERLAVQIGLQLLKSGYLQFRRGPDDAREMRYQMVATVGAVHPSKLDTLERRIAERQDEVAKEVANEAADQIDNFGSYYGHSGIAKSVARQLIGEALQSVLKRRATP